MTYTFSYFTKITQPVIKRRPWWNIFGQDTIELVPRNERKVYVGLSQEEATLLSRATTGLDHTSSLLRRFLKDGTELQLEEGTPPQTPYIMTEGTRTNLMQRSWAASPWERKSKARYQDADGMWKDAP